MIFMHGTKEWPDDLKLLHIYALVDLGRNPRLARLVAAQRAATKEFPLSFVEDRWLHITLAQIVGQSAESLSAEHREALLSELAQQLREVDPVTVMVGSCESYRTGTIYDLSATEALVEVGRRVRKVVEEVFGPEAGAYDTGVLHLTHAYATDEADSDQVQRRLRRVEPGHAPLRIEAVHVVNVRADNQLKTITWDEPLARIPLGAAGQEPEGSLRAGQTARPPGREPVEDLIQAAELAFRQGAFERADDLYTAVLAEVATGRSAGDLWHLQIVRDHALVAYNLGRWAEGEAMLRRVLKGREKLAGRDAPAVIDALARLAEAIGEQERWVEAGALAREAVRRVDLALPDNHEAALGARLALAWVLASTGAPDAEPVVRRLAENLAAVHGPDHRDALAARHLMVEVLRDRQRFQEAADLAQELLVMREATRGAEHPHTLLLRAELALLLHRIGRAPEATVLAEQSLAAIERSQGLPAHHARTIRNIHHEITIG
ncbi:tetratricopeptide repeat protein [Streptomyces sp. NPDC048638]|uniref:tetratricopeptide repeat protein n=1 Tax=Streptomyces sp. NPDC048638 TaxID=3365580 RepID=UPI0037154BBA